MSRIQRLNDYSEHLIRLASLVKKLNESINSKDYEMVKVLANNIKIEAISLEGTLNNLK
jgi:hypothetical protein